MKMLMFMVRRCDGVRVRRSAVCIRGNRRIMPAFSPERQEHKPEHVGGCEERGQRADDPQQRVPLDKGFEQDLVLAEEASQRRYTCDRDCANQERAVCERQLLPEPAHIPDVLLAMQRMDDSARAEEQQRLEKGVGIEVK